MAYGQPVPVTTYDPTNVMGRRIGAWFIDAFLPTVAAVIIGYIVFIGAATKASGVGSDYCTTLQFQTSGAVCLQLGNDAYVGTKDDRTRAIAAGGFVYLLGAVNLFVVQGLTGAAIGKHMLGLRVVRGDGNIAGFGWNALRTLLLVVDQFFCALVGLITALVTHPHRRVGDFASGTYVVAKESVGTPIDTQMGMTSYPPPWTPQSQPSWGPPPTSWGAPAPAPGWGTPPPAENPTPAASPPGAAAPTWGTPAASPPPAATEPPAASAPPGDDAPGWAAPAPAPLPEPTAQPAPQTAAPAKREPQWDAQRNAWVYWEAETNRWLQHDAATGQWGPLR